jgi:hypothetical protein
MAKPAKAGDSIYKVIAIFDSFMFCFPVDPALTRWAAKRGAVANFVG